ncbi:MAG: DNA mismatch repair protein MutS [Bacteroidia bacterium]|nr:DNA mismatch repair protein MutS [Bacteroidia bacterium]
MAKKTKKVTPLMRQYGSIKAKYPDALLLFRVGDFYETFGEDAVKTARILDIILTKRGAGTESETELAGFPHHALNTYLPKLVRAGERVAICDQLEDPKQAKTIVKRGVTELITPGVSLNDEVLQSKSNNFLASVHFGKYIGLSLLDISTGEFLTTQGKADYIDKLLQNFQPSEVLVSKAFKKTFDETFGKGYQLFYQDDWIYQDDYAYENLCQHFKIRSLKGFGIEDLYEGIVASGSILHYISEAQHHRLQHINTIKRLVEGNSVWMDRFTIKNLELFHSTHAEAVTLLDVIDQTISPMGGRMLKRWLALPLTDIEQINHRHDAVGYLLSNEDLRDNIRLQLRQIGDLERLVSKIATAKVSPRELVQLKNSIKASGPIISDCIKASSPVLNSIAGEMDLCEALCDRVEQTLNEDAPVNILKGDTIKSSFSEELAELRSLATSSKAFLDDMLEREMAHTKIPSLKISSNNVFGYYIEVRNTHKDKVPEEWIRKQTLVNAERYITEELKDYEARILGAEERILEIEQRLFEELVQALLPFIPVVQKNARLIAELDGLAGFAELSRMNKYVRPEINNSYELQIKQGRHPVIEKYLPLGEFYIPNDLLLDRQQQQIIMITGPNMSGKSAILRQTALIVILGQIGCFVPAQAAVFGVFDKIFTRVGASDNISMGESTFMVEMNETASILNNISDRSLVLLDEIGRGTSTYDGISIAWAISEYLHEHPTRPKTLFATHYHELNEMTETFKRIRNYNVSVKELKDKVLFMRTLVEGGSAHSFGIHVARMAGMPQQVVRRATKIMKRLEKSHSSEELTESVRAIKDELQLSIFKLDDPLLEEIKDEILHTDIDTLTPVEALMKLNEIKRMLVRKKQA